jgi:class 3 adenylate cyclase
MHLGPFLLGECVGPGPAGFRFAATTPDGRSCEVRTLSRAKADPGAWAALRRRLRFLNLLDHPAAPRPFAADLDHDPPYLAVDPASPFCFTTGSAKEGVAALAGAVAAAHRLGWTLGPDVPLTPHLTADGRPALDLTGTGPGEPAAGDPTPAGDVARLGAVFRGWAELDPRLRPLVERMTHPDPAERPTADEVVALLDRPDTSSGGTDVTAVTDVIDDADLVEPPPADPNALRPGDRVGRFVLRDQLGEGGMGTVFRADDPVDGTVVAVKVLRPAVASSDAARRRFVKEARLASAVDTPFVTRVIEANTDGGRCYLALEFVPGESLGRAVRRGATFDETTALGLIADAARGVAAAHAVGIVHRDLKPDNLLLTGSDSGPRVKVTDFGLARKLVQSESLDITRAGATVGTPLYMPPEQFGSAAVDARSDVYSLGATLFHLLAGRPPLAGDTLVAVAKAVATDPPPALDRVNPDVSAATAALVARCLAKNPDDRPPDAAALVRDLTRLIDGEPAVGSAHPALPPPTPTSRTYTFTWDLKSSPARLWPHVSNTERLNKATGLPAVRYELRKDAATGLVRRFGHARVVGFDMTWEEHAFEWVEGRRMGILREYEKGPFVWFVSVVELTPNGTGGTTLTHTLAVQPRGLLGRVAAPFQVGGNGHRQLDRVYRRMDEVLTAGPGEPAEDVFESQSGSPQVKAKLKAGGEKLKPAADPAAMAALLRHLGTASDQEVARVRPFALARKTGVDEAAMADACLRAVPAGLLQLGWDVICPACRLPSARRDTLRELKDHETCEACDVGYQPEFAKSVELVFRVHPDVRAAEVGRYCAGGPAHSPHVVAQVRLAAGERLELDLSLTPGRYRLRGPQLAWTLDVPVAAGGAVRRWEVGLAAMPSAVPPLAAGGQVLVLTNDRDHPTVVRVERSAERDDALTAARAAALPAFRELFPDELLSPGQLATASAVTLLHVGVHDPDGWLETVGEAAAFQRLQAAVRKIEAEVTAAGGTLVKTVGETAVAAFDRAAAAVGVAHRLVEAVLPAADGSARWKAGVHRGLARIATVNDRLDYFGQTVKVAARLYDAADGGQVLLSEAVTADPEVVAQLQGRRVRLVEGSGGLVASAG